MKRYWYKDPVMRRWRLGRFRLPKSNPTIERWHWPVITLWSN